MNSARQYRVRRVAIAAAGIGLALPFATAVPAVANPATATVRSSISWQDCGSAEASPNAQCGTISVPLDWNRPGGAQIKLAVTKHRATGTKQGTLVFLPGAGFSANDIVVNAAASYFGMLGASALVEKFDIVGIEQRGGAGSLYGHELGLGVSTTPRLTCGTPVHDQTVTTLPATQADFDKLVAHNRAFSSDCKQRTGPLADYLDSVSQARDLEAIRAALGASQVDIMAWHYANITAHAYAELYPQRTHKLVLDGPTARRLPTLLTALQEAAAVERSWNEFVAWCAANPLSPDWLNGCALNGQDVDQLYRQVLADATATPMTTPRLGISFNGEELAFLTQQRLEQGSPNVLGMVTNGWTQLSLSLMESSTRKTANGYSYMWDRAWALSSAWNAYRVSACLDFGDRQGSFAQARLEIAALRQIAPKTGGVSEMWDVRSGCAGVPAGPNRVAPAPGGKISGPSVLAVTSRFNAYAAPEQVRYVASGFTQNRVLEYTESSSIGFFVPGVASQTVGFLTTP